MQVTLPDSWTAPQAVAPGKGAGLLSLRLDAARGYPAPGLAVESAVAGLFVVLGASAITATAWLLVLGYAGHGLKDAWHPSTSTLSRRRQP